ncbi:L-threonylcarbamoyladenylate synthase [Tepidibacillus fermentans]|uniref:Threonylcarbamoyl-AMP synthase n=1 Tax=Tepidibacillus fermentans TaxID=1281767 RepID=A0A4R3K5K7_9BACI|nr:L-threonylcarbamoyladenylate synthase [Tepidibacillus fermentans]TCS78035.1 translation factor SUA5 [Tepidibacillus fermentans]
MFTTKTKLWYVDKNVDEYNPTVMEIGDRLRKGEVIAFPTETVYGLGANALDSNAVRKIFEAKGRPSDNPLIVHIASFEQLNELVTHIDEKSKQLMARFWPGPLTIIFPSKGKISELVTSLPTVAIRMPDHPIALAIIRAAQVPIAAPSANRSGKPSPTKAEHVWSDLHGRIDGIVDGGNTGYGVESTVIDVSGDEPVILRPGGVTIEQLEEVIGEVEIDPALVHKGEKPKAPGMKYTHYAPDAEMWLVQGEEEKVIQEINRIVKEKSLEGRRVGVLTTKDHQDRISETAYKVLAYGNKDDLTPFAANVYDALRQFDKDKIDFILAEAFPETGIGLAIMNRLKKAAGGNILKV